jgi:hypothetical protein
VSLNSGRQNAASPRRLRGKASSLSSVVNTGPPRFRADTARLTQPTALPAQRKAVPLGFKGDKQKLVKDLAFPACLALEHGPQPVALEDRIPCLDPLPPAFRYGAKEGLDTLLVLAIGWAEPFDCHRWPFWWRRAARKELDGRPHVNLGAD